MAKYVRSQRETSHDLLTGMFSNAYIAQYIQTNIKPERDAGTEIL